MDLRVTQEEAVLVIHADAKDADSAYVLESNYLGWISMCLSYFLGRAISLSAVSTRDAKHARLGAQHWSLGAPLRFGSVAALHFPASLLLAPRVCKTGSDAFWDCLRFQLEAGERSSLFGFGQTPGALPRVRDLARRAGVTSSTMSRRLGRDGDGFRGARRRAIVEAATGLLVLSDVSVDAVAVELGYADARSFRRFIRRATGKTPLQLRRTGIRPSDHEVVYQRIRELARAMSA